METHISNNDVLAQVMFELLPESERLLVTGSGRFEKNSGWYIYATMGLSLVGYIASNVFDDHISVSIVVRHEYRRMGVGEELGRAMIEEMHNRGYQYMIWRAAQFNKGSRRVAEKLGGEYIETSDNGWVKYKIK